MREAGIPDVGGGDCRLLIPNPSSLIPSLLPAGGWRPWLPSRSFPAFARPSGSRRSGSARSSRLPPGRPPRSLPYGRDPARCRSPASGWRGCLPPTGCEVGRRPPWGRASRGLEVGGQFLGQRKPDGEVERAPLALFAFDPDAPAHQLHQTLPDGEPQAGAAETPRHGSVGLGEGLEEMLQVGGGMPIPVSRTANSSETEGIRD